MICFDDKITGEVTFTIFQYVFFKKFFAIMPKMHISINNANASVIEANDLVVKANDLIVKTMH
jgi:hypothetical protein